MISEHQFSSHYSSVWHTIAPLADGFWAIENKQVDRFDLPLASTAKKEMRAIINEVAFRSFCDRYSNSRPVANDQIVNSINENLQPAIDYVSRFSNVSQVTSSHVDIECRQEAASLAVRLLQYLPFQSNTILRPVFSGCGLISQCEGDLIFNDCLYEIKAGERKFRLMDLRQLLTYAALAYADRALNFTHIGLINPRTGVTWMRSLDEVCKSISGLRLNDTLSDLVEQFSIVSVSR